jgi:uncharacterized membrane protein
MLPVFRSLHVISALLFFGGLMPVACLMGGVLRQREPAARLAGLKLLVTANRRFLLPGSILAGLTGFAYSGMKHVPILSTGWLLASVVAYLVAMVASMAVLAPFTRRVLAAAEAAVNSGSSAEVDALAALPLQRGARVLVALCGVAVAVLMVWRP